MIDGLFDVVLKCILQWVLLLGALHIYMIAYVHTGKNIKRPIGQNQLVCNKNKERPASARQATTCLGESSVYA